jgi:3-phenylpropionate/trans-cinnamate dioxygenase ferredoxin reductase component
VSDRLVIIGGGQAGFACAARLRALQDNRPVTILAGENVLPYQRPPLSKKYLLGEMSLDRLMFRPAEWFDEHDVEIRLGCRATSIDRAARTVLLDDGSSLGYGQLAFATGSSPRKLPASIGGDLKGVFTVRSFADADALRPVMQPDVKLLIVGGGYIGLEAAAIARTLGLEVTLIEMADRILARVAAAQTAGIISAIHRGRGVDIREKTGLVQLIGDAGHVTGAQLSDGSTIAADIVIAGIGAASEDELARTAGISCDNGILVDEFGRSSDPDVYAMGDCANQLWKGARVRLESVQNAVDQADNVADNLTGAQKPYRPHPWFWSDQYDVKLQIAGFNYGYEETFMRPGAREGAFSVWYFAGGNLIAVDAINDAKAYVIGKKLLESGHVSGIMNTVQDLTADLKTLI